MRLTQHISTDRPIGLPGRVGRPWRARYPRLASRLSLAGALLVGTAGVCLTANGVAAAATSSCTGSWPTYQHDAYHTADACSALSPAATSALRPAWFVPTAGAVTAEPTVADNSVFLGDSSGAFHALNQGTGASKWTFSVTSPKSCYLDQPNPYADRHNSGFGAVTSSAAFAPTVNDTAGNPMVYFGGGGTLFALDAVTGGCVWAQDIDPGNPKNNVEIESSPVVDTAVDPPEVVVGSDDNSGAGHGVTGLQAFTASTGALQWRYEPERDVTLTPGEFGGSDALTLSCGDGSANSYCTTTNAPGIGENSTSWADACGDVWSSPSLDTTFTDPEGNNSYESEGTAATTDPVWFPKQVTATGKSSKDGLVVFGTGNCGASPNPATTYAHHDYAHAEGVFALDPVTGVRVWNWFEPANLYNTDSPNEAGGGDTDFGGSSILAAVPTADLPAGRRSCGSAAKTTKIVIQGGKSGYAYGLCEGSGTEAWGVQVAQAGQLSPDLVGAVGGFIGSPSIGEAKGRPAAFFDSALFLPFADDGVRMPGNGDDAGATCPGMTAERLPLLPVCPDPSLANDPARLLSVSGIDAATGHLLWRAPSTPSYAATTYSNGVVFASSTTGYSAAAFDADTGLPLWSFPLGDSPASGASIVGSSVFLGTGISEGTAGPSTVPPGNNGIWSFRSGA